MNWRKVKSSPPNCYCAICLREDSDVQLWRKMEPWPQAGTLYWVPWPRRAKDWIEAGTLPEPGRAVLCWYTEDYTQIVDYLGGPLPMATSRWYALPSADGLKGIWPKRRDEIEYQKIVRELRQNGDADALEEACIVLFRAAYRDWLDLRVFAELEALLKKYQSQAKLKQAEKTENIRERRTAYGITTEK